METNSSSPLSNGPIKWSCPVCIPFHVIERYTQTALDIAIGMHIRWHEGNASQKSVDKARIQCSNPNCEIGTTRTYNMSTHEWETKLTDFDLKLLEGMKIKW